ncbi:MAG TPA: hypothetical protein VLA24_10875 [Pseudomonadales bacterium]|nr:hypothetical protein [Pseudomonadales bacterium]
MPASLIEIVQLPSGEIVVRRVDTEGERSDAEPLAKIIFSADARDFMGDATMEVARAMIQAGLDTVSELMDEMDDTDDALDNSDDEARPQGLSERTLH